MANLGFTDQFLIASADINNDKGRVVNIGIGGIFLEKVLYEGDALGEITPPLSLQE